MSIADTDNQATSHSRMAVTRDLEQVAQAADLVPKSLMRPIERTVQILRYYRKDQILRRIGQKLSFGKTWGGAVADPWSGEVRLDEGVRAKLAQVARLRSVRTDQGIAALREGLRRGEFQLLEERRGLGRPIDWCATGLPRPTRLWRFHLHYHEYLLDAVAGSGWHCSATWATVWDVVESWIDGNPVAHANQHRDAWHPYCISRRLSVWLQLLAISMPSGQRFQKVLASCAQQAEFLSRRLETDLDGNHLLENIHALALAGAALSADGNGGRQRGSRAWLELAESKLRHELPRQLLPHGEHFERSPMYHGQVLGHLLQLAIVLRQKSPQFAEFCRDAAGPMCSFLATILHPDGEIPSFADSCFGESYSGAELRRLAEVAGTGEDLLPPRESAVSGPYWVWRHNDDAWIFDRGQLAANCLPAHGHCDLLGFEATIAGQRWFIDSGNFDYNDAAMRQYCRSSVAHNVATIDDRNQCDIWSTFRMGRRGWPTWFDTGVEGPFCWAAAAHNAYRRFGVKVAERVLVASTNDLWACVDRVRARSPKLVTGRLHLAPGMRIEQVDEYKFRLELNGNRRILEFLGVSQVSLAAGWYCIRFGRRLRTDVFEYTASRCDSATIGWLLSESPEASLEIIEFEPNSSVNFRDGDSDAVFEWRFGNDRRRNGRG